MKKYAFEYNESEGHFHQNFGDAAQQTNGFLTICETYEFMWDPFSRMLHRRYKFTPDNHPSLDQIRAEWEEYLLLREEIQRYEKNAQQG